MPAKNPNLLRTAINDDAALHMRSVLICGWRLGWSDGMRLKHRLDELTMQLWPGSHVHFLCMLELEAFEEILRSNHIEVIRQGSGLWRFGHIELGLTTGDSTDFDAPNVMFVFRLCIC